jgi:hypothetical protein
VGDLTDTDADITLRYPSLCTARYPFTTACGSYPTMTSTLHSTAHHNPADRVQKLKDARSEAAKEIESYKSSKDADFKKFESGVSVKIQLGASAELVTLQSIILYTLSLPSVKQPSVSHFSHCYRL